MSDSREVAYALLIEGISTIFVTDEVLDGIWAGNQGHSASQAGLSIPRGSLETETNLRDGRFPSSSASFQLSEMGPTPYSSGPTSDVLASIFGGVFEETEPLQITLEPGVTAPAAVFSKHVGIERIGSAGQRGSFPCVPGSPRPLRHYGKETEMAGGLAARVSDSPVTMEGRRFTFYRVPKLADGTWEDLLQSTLVYWGTLTGGGSQQGEEWTIDVDGPHSWIERPLGTHLWPVAFPSRPKFADLSSDEQYVRVRLGAHEESVFGAKYRYGDVEDETAISVPADIASAIADLNTIIDTAQSTVGTSGSFDNSMIAMPWADIAFDGSGKFRIKFKWELCNDLGVGNPGYCWVSVRMHEKVWRLLGYDVDQQQELDQMSDWRYVRFGAANGTGYRTAAFDTRSPTWYYAAENGWPGFDNEIEVDSNGNREFWPLYDAGIASFSSSGNQEILISTGGAPIFMPGQLSQPPADDPANPGEAYPASTGDVTDQHIFIFTGPYLGPGDDEPKTISQVARCSYRVGGNGMVQDGLDVSVYLHEWLSPALVGLPDKKFTGSWPVVVGDAENAIRCRPLAELAYRYSAGDLATKIVRRILITTGTATGWWTDDTTTTRAFGYDSDWYFEAGSGGSYDAEIASLGLGIPSTMVAGSTVWAEANEPLGDSLRYGKEYLAESKSSADVLAGILAPRGWAWSLRGQAYGVFNPDRLVGPDDVDVVITPESYDNPRQKPTAQRHRLYGAIGSVEVSAGMDPVERDFTHKTRIDCKVSSVMYAATGVEHNIEAPGLLDPAHLLGASAWWSWARWTSDFRARWDALLAFWSRRHFPVRLVLHTSAAESLWPGARVMVTDPSIYDPYARTYGISGMTGYCFSRSENIEDETTTVEVLLHAGSSYGTRQYAPAARVWSYDPNLGGLGFRLQVQDNYLGFRGDTLDVQGFVEGANTAHGGNALIEVFQYDRSEWTGGIYGTVSSVNVAPGDSYIVLTGALTGGTFYRDRDSIVVLRNWTSQTAAWVLALLAPICDKAGEVAAAPGIKFTGG